jgi:alcohol dehydrogenase
MLLGSCFAGMAFANAPVAAVHALAYPIGSLFHVPHGLSNSLILPQVIRFNNHHAQCSEQYRVAQGLLFAGQPGAAASGFSLDQQFLQLALDLGLPTKLSQIKEIQQWVASQSNKDADAGKRSVCRLLATDAMKQTRLLPNNPREVTEEDAYHMYLAAY